MPVIALTLLVLAGARAGAQEDSDERERLRARVEHVRDDPQFTLRGTALASRRVLLLLEGQRGWDRAALGGRFHLHRPLPAPQ